MRESITSADTDTHVARPRRLGPHTTSRPPSNAQRLLSIQQAVIEYGLPIGTLRDLVFRGALRRVVLPDGRRWWFDRRDLERFIDESKRVIA